MIDLTPLDVRKKRGDFRRILRGYDPEEVDTFMDLVAERFEELVRENLSLSDKTSLIETQLRALEGRERAVQDALVTAQKLREDVKDQTQRDVEVLQDQASRSAELLKSEADAEIGRRLGEAEGLIHERQRALEDLERSRLKFLKSFRGLLERELDAVEVEESRRPLEDTPLELDLRGWTLGRDLEDEAEEGDGPEEEVESEAPETSTETVEAEPEAPPAEEFEPDPLSEPEPPVGLEVEAEVESEVDLVIPVEASGDPAPEPLADDAPVESAEEELDEGVPGGFETQVLEAAVPAGLSEFPGEAEEEDMPVANDGEDAPSPQEPKWLFSLLKKEEEKGGGE